MTDRKMVFTASKHYCSRSRSVKTICMQLARGASAIQQTGY